MNELTIQNNNTPINYTQEQINVIKNTVAQGATDTELALFLNQCKRTGLDAMTRQIYFIKDKNGKVQTQTSVDGFRLIAERSDKYEGQTKAEWCGSDGQWVDIWLKKEPPAAARVGVYKKGFREALYAVALFEEYAQRHLYDDKYGKFKSGDLTFIWNKMPSLMIAKVAECLALRKAFPNDLSGIYSSEEMAQAEVEKPKQVRAVIYNENIQNDGIPAGDKQYPSVDLHARPISTNRNDEFSGAGSSEGITDNINQENVGASNNYTITFGKDKGKTIEEIGLETAISRVEWFRDQEIKTGKMMSEQVIEFCKQVEMRK